jgi:DNA-binding transcriptional LysR family regulator
VGTSSCIARDLLPKAIGRLRKHHHDLPVTIEAAGSEKCRELLDEGRIDFAITLQPERLTGVDASPLFRDELMWVMPPAHPWVLKGHVDRKELSTQGLVLGDRCCPTFAAVERFFAREKIKPKVICEAGDVESQKAHVMEGEGVALLPLWTLRHEIALGNLAVLPIGRRGVQRQWILLRAPATRPALLAEALLREVRSAAAELVSAPMRAGES